jgi:hypothetical protein
MKFNNWEPIAGPHHFIIAPGRGVALPMVPLSFNVASILAHRAANN